MSEEKFYAVYNTEKDVNPVLTIYRERTKPDLSEFYLDRTVKMANSVMEYWMHKSWKDNNE